MNEQQIRAVALRAAATIADGSVTEVLRIADVFTSYIASGSLAAQRCADAQSLANEAWQATTGEQVENIRKRAEAGDLLSVPVTVGEKRGPLVHWLKHQQAKLPPEES